MMKIYTTNSADHPANLLPPIARALQDIHDHPSLSYYKSEKKGGEQGGVE
jgi:hypothetical protein